MEVRRLLTCAPFRPRTPLPRYRPDDPRGNPGLRDPAPVTASAAGPQASGRLGSGASRKRGPRAPLCAGRGRGGGQPPAARPPPLPAWGYAAAPPPLHGRSRALAPPHAPRPALDSYRKGITIPSPPTRHLALSPPPPVTSSSSPVGPSASPHSPPQFAHFRPPSASPCRSAASGVLFFPPLG